VLNDVKICSALLNINYLMYSTSCFWETSVINFATFQNTYVTGFDKTQPPRTELH